jgi:aryl-alcohol dehydrogenase-like predicted oxidoreductase
MLRAVYPVPASAETQGATDRYIATWLQKQRREDLVVMTKVSGRSGITYLRDGGMSTCVDRKQIRESVEKSLRRLGIDEVDLLQVHWPDRYSANGARNTHTTLSALHLLSLNCLLSCVWCHQTAFGMRWFKKDKQYESVPIREQLEGLKEMVDEGKVRSVGLSNETPYGITRFSSLAEEHGLPSVASTQNAYNLLSRIQQEWSLPETLSYCNVGFLAYSPLAGGVLSNKYADGNMPAGSRFSLFSGYMSRYQRSMEAAHRYADVARKHGMSASELALKFWCAEAIRVFLIEGTALYVPLTVLSL